MSEEVLLEVDDLGITFGGVRALDAISFGVREQQICGLIGPNGAGKTTLFNCITRLYQPTAGSIRFAGRDVLALRPHQVVGAGIARTFQNLALFEGMNVLENVLSGASSRSRLGFTGSLLGLPAHRRSRRALEGEAYELIERLDLLDVALEEAQGLPFGTLKRVELARALMARPRLLLMDEPAGGLTHAEVDELGTLIRDLKAEFGFAALLVEHHMGLVMSCSDRVVAMDFGRVVVEGTPTEVREHPAVVEAYLGRTA